MRKKTDIYTLFEIENDVSTYIGTFSSYENALDVAIEEAQDTVDFLNKPSDDDDELMISFIDEEGTTDKAVIVSYVNEQTRKKTEDDFDISYEIIYGLLDVRCGNEEMYKTIKL